ncbi:hypothetical protein BO86DRAFT_391762 [Aspergillus japonicus CBS 114.51]|uniref:Uncharacterized protein n=2 Tax=Aspergillus TaxID=5052 RepID=A0A2V5H8F7_ASPV1|nr:hypothetical protein BO86DRAFT_391762 [Aspergillus japonicus CBS 114.51]PYI19851.1 hypothetical protein BO99DRAFT_332137 [Aspergillus violaceofuscus CBS 115571]RAH78494.1 hypothetical protein BO86DRAFT_391762 [Aspergillus japonicus CBS 114.51]
MGPTKPILHPLTTPKNMSFPSELRERTYTTCLDLDRPSIEKKDEETEITITPPPAYTDFLNTFSPIFSSPTSSRANFSKYMLDKPRSPPSSTPSSTTSTTFPLSHCQKVGSAAIPPRAPSPPWASKSSGHGQHLRLPPPYACTPTSESPRSAHPLRSPLSPSEWRIRQFESPVSDVGNSFSIRHVVTTTITYKRAPQLDPPPQGKRRKNASRRTT